MTTYMSSKEKGIGGVRITILKPIYRQLGLAHIDAIIDILRAAKKTYPTLRRCRVSGYSSKDSAEVQIEITYFFVAKNSTTKRFELRFIEEGEPCMVIPL
jgi:hypothetical protein